MRGKIIAAGALAVLLAGGIAFSWTAAQESRTIFDTPDFRQDRALWATPAYWRNNTAGNMRGMALDIEAYGETGQPSSARPYGSEGAARAGALNLQSPYPFKTAREHYESWLKEANGGTKHTRATIPDWGGRWDGGGGFGGGQAPVSDLVKLLTPQHQEYFVQDIKAQAEGRLWWAGAFCLPGGFFSTLGAEEFLVSPEKVITLSAGNGSNSIRWIYTDGSGHTAENLRFPKWHGESIGFWNDDTLVVHTNQIRAWKGGLSEHSEKMETVERYRRVGEKIEGEITIYDPDVFVAPIHTKMTFELDTKMRPETRPLYNTCTDTNGPAPKVFMDENGLLNERLSGEGAYQWDVSDPRPWGTWLDESDKRFAASKAAGR